MKTFNAFAAGALPGAISTLLVGFTQLPHRHFLATQSRLANKGSLHGESLGK